MHAASIHGFHNWWRNSNATLVSLVLLLVFGTDAGYTRQADTVEAPALRDELVLRTERDQEARRAAIAWGADHGVDGYVDEELLTVEEQAVHTGLWDEVARIDRDNTEWLKGIINDRGWLTYSEVGIDGGDAAWLLVQHADADPIFQRQCLDLMMAVPPEEMSRSSLALLTDRVLLAEGEKQIYGTQFVVQDDEWVPLRLEDEENVDVRRAEVGLPPLAEYKALLEAMMRGEQIE